MNKYIFGKDFGKAESISLPNSWDDPYSLANTDITPVFGDYTMLEFSVSLSLWL